MNLFILIMLAVFVCAFSSTGLPFGARGERHVEEIPKSPFDAGAFEGIVTDVESGDVIRIDGIPVQLAGCAAPKRWWDFPSGCYFAESRKFTEDELLGKKVEYATEISNKGIKDVRRFYHLPRVYVRIGPRVINEEVVKDGFAFADRLHKYPEREKYIGLEEYAKRHSLKLWHTCIVSCRANGKKCRTKY